MLSFIQTYIYIYINKYIYLFWGQTNVWENYTCPNNCCIFSLFVIIWFVIFYWYVNVQKKLSSIFILRLSLSIMISNLQIIFNFVWKYSSWFFKPDLISVFGILKNSFYAFSLLYILVCFTNFFPVPLLFTVLGATSIFFFWNLNWCRFITFMMYRYMFNLTVCKCLRQSSLLLPYCC